MHGTIGKALQQIEGDIATSKMPQICIVYVMSIICMHTQLGMLACRTESNFEQACNY